MFRDVKAQPAALDAINARFGRGAVHLAAEGIRQPWKMKREAVAALYDLLGGAAEGEELGDATSSLMPGDYFRMSCQPPSEL